MPTVDEVMASLQLYIESYNMQHGYEEYTDETIINDVLYGLGIALGEEYRFANGFEDFKDRLIDHINKDRGNDLGA